MKVLPPPTASFFSSLLQGAQRCQRVGRSPFPVLALLCLLLLIPGCKSLQSKPKADYVYVTAKQAYLRDRVAAVSNRVGVVNNGQQLEVLEHQRRWVKVKTEKNEIGWIEERSIATAAVGEEFEKLKQEHAHDPVVGTGTVRDEIYMHLKPGRDTERFFLLPEGEKVQFLERAMAPKPGVPQALGTVAPAKAGAPQAAEKPKPPRPGKHGKPGTKADPNAPLLPPADPSLPPQEDWWLVRDGQGHVGWLLSRRLDTDVPDAIAGYSEGQRIVGAYVLTTVVDREAQRPDPNIPVYAVVLNAYKDGLPYDFDQLRVFTWNTKKHRYETAYRERNLEGFLPVTIGKLNEGADAGVPTFSFKAVPANLQASQPTPDADGKGETDPGKPAATAPAAATLRLYRLDGVLVKRILSPEDLAAKEAARAAGHSAPGDNPSRRAGHRRH